MFTFIREHQMNIMLALCAICGMMVFLLLFTRFLALKRKWILIGMEAIATGAPISVPVGENCCWHLIDWHTYIRAMSAMKAISW